jgi:signal transduction histidine kinase
VALLVAIVLYFADKLRWHVANQRQAHLESLVAARTAILEQRTAELERANELIREADRAKNQFLASMSHELRTPLNSILGFTGLLMERRDEVPSDRAIRFLGNAHHSAQHLLGLINDLLDISKIEAGRMEVHVDHVAIRPLVESTIETIQGFAAPRNIEVVASIADDLPLVKLDGVKVRQILYNLLSNAIKFSLTGGTVQLDVRAVSAESSPTLTDAIEIAVTDHGSGIPASELRTIFEEFRQSSVTAKLGLGTGLGLAIVSEFAALQGGQVSVESRPGAGSTFRVWLPLDATMHDTESGGHEPLREG